MSPTLDIVRVFPTPELHSGATPLFRLRRNFLDIRRLAPVLTKLLEKTTHYEKVEDLS